MDGSQHELAAKKLLDVGMTGYSTRFRNKSIVVYIQYSDIRIEITEHV